MRSVLRDNGTTSSEEHYNSIGETVSTSFLCTVYPIPDMDLLLGSMSNPCEGLRFCQKFVFFFKQ